MKKKIIMALVCLMTMVMSANAHNTHYPTYTEDGITYVKNGTYTVIEGVRCEPWDVLKVDKPYDRTIVIPSTITINGEKIFVAGIREDAFSTCSELDSLIISDGVWINDNAFRGCNELDYLYYSAGGFRNRNYSYYGLSCRTFETINGVAEEPFWNAVKNSLEKLIIKNTNTIWNRMDYCKKLKAIVCYAVTPPKTSAAKSVSIYASGNCYITFEEYQWSTITLYVPRESLENYYFDRVWGEIDNIYAIDEMKEETSTSDYEETTYNNETTSIRNIDGNTLKENVWYSLNGVKVNNPTKGFYIKNGKKYIVK